MTPKPVGHPWPLLLQCLSSVFLFSPSLQQLLPKCSLSARHSAKKTRPTGEQSWHKSCLMSKELNGDAPNGDLPAFPTHTAFHLVLCLFNALSLLFPPPIHV